MFKIVITMFISGNTLDKKINIKYIKCVKGDEARLIRDVKW